MLKRRQRRRHGDDSKSSSRMRTLLRKVSTGLYYQGPDQWTQNPANAHNFKMIDRALDFVRKWKLTDMEIAFAFDREEVTGMPIEKIGAPYSQS